MNECRGVPEGKERSKKLRRENSAGCFTEKNVALNLKNYDVQEEKIQEQK